MRTLKFVQNVKSSIDLLQMILDYFSWSTEIAISDDNTGVENKVFELEKEVEVGLSQAEEALIEMEKLYKKKKEVKMIKKKLYPHTERIGKKVEAQITEKMDGANIGFFNKDDELLICTRNYILPLSEVNEKTAKSILNGYAGLYDWLLKYGKELKQDIYTGSGIFCEWMGTNGHVKYPKEIRHNKVYIFAKARINDDYNIENLVWDIDLLKYAFKEKVIPEYMDKVPFVCGGTSYPTVVQLNELYFQYTRKLDRNVEGFVIHFDGKIRKYVRMKNGKLEEHNEGK